MHLYERIYEDLKRSIEEGELGPGERLPSIRETAELYGCNKLTVQKAFERLSQAGLAENQIGSGSFVRYRAQPEEGSGDFAASVLSEDFFPYEEAGALVSQALARERGRVFSSAPPRGEARLIEAAARSFGLPPDSLMVTGGGRQGLELVRRYLAERGEARALVEEPTYPGAFALFRPKAALAFGPEGVEPAELEEGLAGLEGPGPRLFYTVPELHNPTGGRYSAARKAAVAEIARRRDLLILEDDYLSELLPQAGPRFVDLAPERTIWVKSLAKTSAPGIRVGFVAAPPAVLARLVEIAAESDPGPAAWLQLLAEGLLVSGLHARCVVRAREVSDRRRGELLGLLARFPALRPRLPEGGYNLWVEADRPGRLPSPPWAPGFRFGRSAACRSAFRLSFMGLGEAEWPRALARLATSLEAAYGG